MGALIEIEEVALAQPRPPGLSGGHIDLPRPGQRVEASAVDVLGWALGDGVPVIAVELWIGDVLVRRVPLAVARPDLAEVFPEVPEAGGAGFRTSVSAHGRSARVEIEVRVVLADQRRVPLGVIRGRRLWREGAERLAPLISVVIPCYDQAHYLGDAIESVMAQTYPHFEIVVIDDGSHDNAATVAGAYPGVQVIRQHNLGLAEARNAGLRASRGDYLVFLDADDRLLPNALEVGLNALREHPESGMVWGASRDIGADGRESPLQPTPVVTDQPYLDLLADCIIWTPAAVMYRRGLFEELRCFDAEVSASADYDVYLRAARDFPVHQHGETVAEYRRHGANMTRRHDLILRSEVAVLRRQRAGVAGSRRGRRALRAGLRRARRLHGPPVVGAMTDRLSARDVIGAARLAWLLIRYDPKGLMWELLVMARGSVGRRSRRAGSPPDVSDE